jgi:hypothetical protein
MNCHAEFLAEGFHGFALQQAQHCIGFCAACNAFVTDVRPTLARRKRLLTGIHKINFVTKVVKNVSSRLYDIKRRVREPRENRLAED